MLTGYRKLDIREKDWKLGLPNWNRVEVGKRRERREREAGPYCSSEKESDGQQGPVAKETVTLVYSHQN